MRERISGVYQIRNTRDGKVYIGSSVDISKRWKEHLKGDKGNPQLQKAFHELGVESFEFSILELCIKGELARSEQKWLDAYPPKMKFNACSFAYSVPGHECSEETRAKISATSMGNKWNVGKHHSAETKAKISMSSLGKPKRTLTPEHKAKIAASLVGNQRAKGFVHTVETREKCSASGRGRINGPMTAERKARIGAANSRRTRMKISEQRDG